MYDDLDLDSMRELEIIEDYLVNNGRVSLKEFVELLEIKNFGSN